MIDLVFFFFWPMDFCSFIYINIYSSSKWMMYNFELEWDWEKILTGELMSSSIEWRYENERVKIHTALLTDIKHLMTYDRIQKPKRKYHSLNIFLFLYFFMLGVKLQTIVLSGVGIRGIVGLVCFRNIIRHAKIKR